MRPIPSLRCLACGGEVEASLASLGSVRCHDCRDSRRPLDGSYARNGDGSGHANGRPVTLTIRLRDAAQASDLVEFLRVRACEAERARGNLVHVRPHPTLRPAHVRAEVEALLGAWQATRPGTRPVLIG
jgi:hypothetical protein